MMKNAADVVVALAATKKRTAKETILRDAWDSGITEFFSGAMLAYDAIVTFGVKKVPLLTEADPLGFVPAATFGDFLALAQKLNDRELSGNAAKSALAAAADSYSQHEWNNFYRAVLLKDLRCGITESTINKVLEDTGSKTAQKYIIPVFSCQLAKNGDDHPKKVSGIKMLDTKLDGVRLLTVFDKHTDTVTQYTRNGQINENFTAITDKLKKLLPVFNQSMVLDGEVVSDNFQALMKQVNRKTGVDTRDAYLALFDIIPLQDFLAGTCTITQKDRHDILVGLTDAIHAAAGDTVYVIPKLTVDLNTPEGQKTFKDFNRETVDAGYEGIMVKNPDAFYYTKRTDGWLKLKPFVTFDLEVMEVVAGTPGSKYENTMGAVLFAGEDQGRMISVSVGSGWSDEMRDQIWEVRDQILGRIGEIKGDALTKSQNGDSFSLRFPVFMRFRGWEPGEKI